MKGVYALNLEVLKDTKLRVGSLGIISLKKGNYSYVGSALNNLEKRIERHFRKNKKIHWHIDYLTTSNDVKIISAFYKETINKEEECKLAEEISRQGIAVKRFGCTDCSCDSHLFYLKDYSIFKNFLRNLLGFSLP
ncbi:MAG: GIY-YIG nuclease family protein [Nanoarchaeota archaeon]|nr:GIY-YIG nuclease family protein [Nanoarchaeota archaeon]